MKPRNFPARRLRRQMVADATITMPFNETEQRALDNARAIRTKKRRCND